MLEFVTRKQRQSGLTMVEMLIVVLILAVLATIIVPNLIRARAKSRDDTRIAAVQEVALALEQYRSICGEYPNDLALTTNNGCSNGETLDDFISVLPEHSFFYTSTTQGNDHPYLYYPMTTVSGSGECYKYHLGLEVEISARSELTADADFNSRDIELGVGTPPYRCVSGNEGFNGDDANLIYDLAR